MAADDPNDESLEETLRSIARELGRSIERSVDSVDVDEFADAVGIDPMAARGWVESASSWLRAQTENLGEGFAERARQSRQVPPPVERLVGVQPHPLDLPTDEQGLALAALDSGRWTVEPGTDALAAKGEGPGPSDALGIVRELRTRDWIDAGGELTLAGRHALSRWLDSAATR